MQVGGEAIREPDDAEGDPLIMVVVLVDMAQMRVGRIPVDGSHHPIHLRVAGEHEAIGELPAALARHLVASAAVYVNGLHFADLAGLDQAPGGPDLGGVAKHVPRRPGDTAGLAGFDGAVGFGETDSHRFLAEDAGDPLLPGAGGDDLGVHGDREGQQGDLELLLGEQLPVVLVTGQAAEPLAEQVPSFPPPVGPAHHPAPRVQIEGPRQARAVAAAADDGHTVLVPAGHQ